MREQVEDGGLSSGALNVPWAAIGVGVGLKFCIYFARGKGSTLCSIHHL